MEKNTLTLLVSVVLAVWHIASTNGACYDVTSSIITEQKTRYEVVYYSYRNGFWNWGRGRASRSKAVTYTAYVITYSRLPKPCPVNGGWGPTKYGQCSVTCGRGYLTSTRECNNPSPAHGGRGCVGPKSRQHQCDKGCCPVDGGWSSWTQGSCSKTCGGGIRRYTRSCNNPATKCGGSYCRGNNTYEEACNKFCCIVDGGWSSWTQGPCSKTCDYGIRNFTRTCNNPIPSCGGLSCNGNNTLVETCFEACCSVDGGWSSWTQGSCSKSCGGGIRKYTRSCNNPPPLCGGLSCNGSSTFEEACNKDCCRVDGRWSLWRPVGSCSKTCGGGVLKFTRACNRPAPSCGGSRCYGISIFEAPCNRDCCKVDGGWSDWSVGNCSKLCGGGVQNKTRSCSNPPPSCGGKNCVGQTMEVVECNNSYCIGQWSNWNKCSVSCGNGTKYRTRTCVTDCENGTIEYKSCNMGCCPVDGGWSSWYNQTECSVSCGGGVLTQQRTCTQPSPSCNGSYCVGENVTTVVCNSHCCQVHGGWSNWSVGECSASCNGGNKTKTRSCNNPMPSCGGSDCIGKAVETVKCNETPCVGSWSNWSECSRTCGNATKFRNRTCLIGCENGTVEYNKCHLNCCQVDGGWSEWKIGPCSKTCGGGYQNYTRTCDSPTPSCGGKDCDGPSSYTHNQMCNSNCCPVDGGWSDWQNITNCSATCGEGMIIQERTCTQPKSSCGGRDCLGENVINVTCNNCCPVNGGWSEWEPGPCTKTCGGGKMSMIRKCNNPEPACGGNNCVGSDSFPLEAPCNDFCCPVEGGWSEWKDMSGCSVTCGEGIKVQIRSCSEPNPSCNGKFCEGNDLQFVSCNVSACCPVHGNWSVWKLGECSRTCGGGILNYTRVCNNPAPSCGGKGCDGLDVYSPKKKCNDICCPVDGGWSDWLIGNCSASCFKEKTRLCNNPAPSCGGKNCSGPAVEVLKCSEYPCEDGWGNWSKCSVTCGNGTKFRTRKCIGECNGKSIEIQYNPCYMGCCPVDGRWGNWIFEPCSKSCGGGRQSITRKCNNPKPSCNGSSCDGINYHLSPIRCNDFCCPVDGGWSVWNVGSCSVTCGGGIKEKFRHCNNPTPICGGKFCNGSNTEIMGCNEFPCK